MNRTIVSGEHGDCEEVGAACTRVFVYSADGTIIDNEDWKNFGQLGTN